MALHQLALWHYGHLRLSQRHLFLLQGVVGRRAGAASFSALELGRERRQEIEVWAYCNQDSVELFLNGASLGSQQVKKNGHLVWKVKYAPGTMEASASKGGRVVLTEKRETAGTCREDRCGTRPHEDRGGWGGSVSHQPDDCGCTGTAGADRRTMVTFAVSGPGS